MVRQLTVCLDSIAALRQTRRVDNPDPVSAAAVVETAGARGIVVHLREDRRYTKDRDARLLRQTVKTSLNLRMPATQEMLKLAYDIKPDEVTIVPETPDDLTSGNVPMTGLHTGLDIIYYRDHVRKFIQALRDADLGVCVFLEPDLDQIRAAHRADIRGVVLNTSKFADARGHGVQAAERQRVEDAARAAHKIGMRVAAGGGLNFYNLVGLRNVAEIVDFHVGHGIVAQSLITGLDCAVRDMVALING